VISLKVLVDVTALLRWRASAYLHMGGRINGQRSTQGVGELVI